MTISFGHVLRQTRETGEISLRGLAKDSGIDAAYLSRVERELNPPPKIEVINLIAQSLCHMQQLDTSDCEKLKRTLLESSEQLTDHSDLIRDLKHRFADRLRDEGVEESFIIDAIKKVSLESMEKVLNDEEPLKIISDSSFSSDLVDQMLSNGEEMQMLSSHSEINSSPPFKDSASDYINRHLKKRESSKSISMMNSEKSKERKKKSTFKAGSKAVIEVDGNLTTSQEEQLRSIASLVRSILKDKK
jgi:transcriptional regulator with XRE-family HTH domain